MGTTFSRLKSFTFTNKKPHIYQVACEDGPINDTSQINNNVGNAEIRNNSPMRDSVQANYSSTASPSHPNQLNISSQQILSQSVPSPNQAIHRRSHSYSSDGLLSPQSSHNSSPNEHLNSQSNSTGNNFMARRNSFGGYSSSGSFVPSVPPNMDLSYSAMSLGMDNEDLLFNLYYFGGAAAMNDIQSVYTTAIEETFAAHSTGNTPYKLRPASDQSLAQLKAETLTAEALKRLHNGLSLGAAASKTGEGGLRGQGHGGSMETTETDFTLLKKRFKLGIGKGLEQISEDEKFEVGSDLSEGKEEGWAVAIPDSSSLSTPVLSYKRESDTVTHPEIQVEHMRDPSDQSVRAVTPETGSAHKEESSSRSPGSDVGEEVTCAICKEELLEGEKVTGLPACGHYFHYECVVRWLKLQGWCPICRAEILPATQTTVESAPNSVASAGSGGIPSGLPRPSSEAGDSAVSSDVGDGTDDGFEAEEQHIMEYIMHDGEVVRVAHPFASASGPTHSNEDASTLWRSSLAVQSESFDVVPETHSRQAGVSLEVDGHVVDEGCGQFSPSLSVYESLGDDCERPRMAEEDGWEGVGVGVERELFRPERRDECASHASTDEGSRSYGEDAIGFPEGGLYRDSQVPCAKAATTTESWTEESSRPPPPLDDPPSGTATSLDECQSREGDSTISQPLHSGRAEDPAVNMAVQESPRLKEGNQAEVRKSEIFRGVSDPFPLPARAKDDLDKDLFESPRSLPARIPQSRALWISEGEEIDSDVDYTKRVDISPSTQSLL